MYYSQREFDYDEEHFKVVANWQLENILIYAKAGNMDYLEDFIKAIQNNQWTSKWMQPISKSKARRQVAETERVS